MINNIHVLKTSKAVLLGIVVCAFIISTIACRPSKSEEEQDPTGHAHAADDNHSHAATNEQPPAPTPKAPTPTDDAHDHAPSTDTVLVSLPVDDHQLERLDLAVQPVLAGGLDAWLRVPGEIKINYDTMAHMVPRAAGIVKKVYAELGDFVKTGQLLAIIESRDLATAKSEYLALQERLTLIQTRFDREKQLHAQQISSTAEFLDAQQALAEIRIQLRSTRQKLLIFGMQGCDVDQLASQPEATFADYHMTAPFDGTIIRKHIVLGEAVDDHSQVFEIADLTKVWADLLIPQLEVAAVHVGQTAIIVLTNQTEEVTGTLHYVDPVIHPDTRAAIARVVLDNTEGQYRPGLFITGRIRTRQIDQHVIVPTASIQSVNDQKGVFVPCKDGFEFRSVVLGLSDQSHTEIRSGLKAGEFIVTKNAFHLKAEMSKGAADAHAGHSH